MSTQDVRACLGKPTQTAKLQGVPFDAYRDRGLTVFYANNEVFWAQFSDAAAERINPQLSSNDR